MLRAEFFKLTDKLPAEVIEVLRKHESQGFEQGLDWYINIDSTVFASEKSLWIAVCYKEAHVLSVFPFHLTEDNTIWTLDAPCNFYSPLFVPYFHNDFDCGGFAFLLSEITSRICRFSRVVIFPLDPESKEFKVINSGLSAAFYGPFSFFCFGNWFLPVASDWRTYLSQRDGHLRSTLKRKAKDFSACGGEFELIAGEDRIEYALQAYLAVYRTSWKVPEPYPLFIPGLVKMLARKGWLRLGVATLNGKPIAVQLWVVAYGKASIFKLAYDKAYKRYSVGTLLSAFLMEQVIDKDKVREVDYLIGDDPYKAFWMTHRRERWGIVAYNLRSLGGLLGWCREVSGRLIKFLIARKGPAKCS
jgi:hypothetical protein